MRPNPPSETFPTSVFLLRSNMVQLINFETGPVLKQTILDCSPDSYELKSSFSNDQCTYVVHSNSEVLLFNLEGKVMFRATEKGICKARFLEGSSRLFVKVVKAGSLYQLGILAWNGTTMTKLDQLEAGFFKPSFDYVRLDVQNGLIGIQTKPNELDFYSENSNKLTLRYHLEIPTLILDFQVRPSLVFISAEDQREGKPTVAVSIYRLLNTPNLEHKRIFNNVQEAKLIISTDGTSALVNALRIVDTTGNSYYGLEKVFFYNNSKKVFDEVASFKGSIHDVKHSVSQKHFAVISGSVPSFTVLYDSNNSAQFMLSNDFRNTLFFAPNDAFVAVAGFGSLNGEIEIWNYQTKEYIGGCTSSFASFLKWGSDSAFFVTAIIIDKLKVDHRFSVYSYNGILIKKVCLDINDLINVDFAYCKPTDQTVIDNPHKRNKEAGALIKHKMQSQKIDDERIKNYVPGETHMVKIATPKPTLTVGGGNSASKKEVGGSGGNPGTGSAVASGTFFNSKKGGDNKFKVKRDY